MANATELKSKFTDLLKSMFQLDQPELDFGLYRIMHAKADRINHFLDKELAQQIDVVFADADQADQNQAIEAAKQKLVSQLGYGAFDENGELAEHFKDVPAAKEYLTAVEQAKSGKGNLSERAVIYDHLIRFFKRYYDGGDFMSRRYHVVENKSRAAAYAVPYDGSEVYLHWANKDQYYIKTTESFTLYSFDIAEAAKKHSETSRQSTQGGLLDLDEPTPLANKRIHFKLVDAAQGEHNNNKESEKRQFFIRAENPVALNNDGELEVYFEFRVATKADTISAEQEKQLKSRFGASNKGDLPNLYITQVIQDALSEMQTQPGVEDFVAFAQIQAPTDKIKQRPLITKYINNYTSKNTMDYFIHKDLGGFLQRELDFYIKNEIMRLDDIEQADDANYVRLLKQIKTLRGVAKDIITFLAQLENFQKKLWLKKKFVTETHYCISLDYLSDEPKLLDIVFNNGKQRREWVKIYGIKLSELDDLMETGLGNVLKVNKFKYLMLDTQFFSDEFRDNLFAKIDGVEQFINGLLINSDNFHTLNLMQEGFKEKVKCLYIDPPYNTGNDGFTYKDRYQHSSWFSFVYDRASLAKSLLMHSGLKFVSISDEEQAGLKFLLDNVFEDNYLGTIEWNSTKSVTNTALISVGHTHNYIYAKELTYFTKNRTEFRLPDSMDGFTNPDDDPRGPWKADPFQVGGERPNQLYEIKNPLTGKIYKPNAGCSWKNDYKKFRELLEDNRIVFGASGEAGPQRKRFWKEAEARGKVAKTWWDDVETTTNGTQLLKNMFGESIFTNPKPVELITRFLQLGLNEKDQLVVDYFAGSGTTGHAVINLNREDEGERKFILCEMGGYFEEVTKPRILKASYSKTWKDGKPVFDSEGKAGGISQCFKYLRLEQYEDTLNNLVDSRAYNPDAVPKDFMLSYLLDAETAESPSLLNLEQFSQPRNYKLQIKKPNSDQSSPQLIDLVETFNWLIGLHVEKLDKWRAYDCQFEREHDPELPQDQNTRLKVTKMKETSAYTEDAPVFQVRTVEGWVRQIPGNDELRDKVLVIWRNLSDDAEKDSAFLEALLEKWKINQADGEFDKIYINGPHGLQLRGSAKTRLLSLEDTFMTKMWEDA